MGLRPPKWMKTRAAGVAEALMCGASSTECPDLRPAKGDEDAGGRCRGSTDVWRVFNGVPRTAARQR